MRRLPSRDGAIDAALAVATTALNVARLLAPDPSTSYDFRDSHGLGVVLAAACGLCLLWRRTRPLASFLVIVSVTGLVTSLSWDPGHLPFTVLLSGYALGAFGTLSGGGVGMGVAAGWFALLSGIGAPSFDSVLGVAEDGGVMVAVWLLGRAVAHRRAQAERARERAVAIARDGARESERTVLAEGSQRFRRALTASPSGLDTGSWRDTRAAPPGLDYLTAMAALAGPVRGRTSTSLKPASLHHPARSAPV